MKRGRNNSKSLQLNMLQEKHDINVCFCRRLAGRKKNLKLAIYHIDLGRMYKRTNQEKVNGILYCPKCKRRGELEGMELKPFTKSVKIWICPVCDWKITTNNII